VNLFDLARPEHVDDPAWDAVELARRRLVRAWELEDLAEFVGRAKELVETVAKVVFATTKKPLATRPTSHR
jgi:hypothetical protein